MTSITCKLHKILLRLSNNMAFDKRGMTKALEMKRVYEILIAKSD